MDNKEAVAVIRSNWPDLKYSMLIEALEMSIKSLEAAESAQTAHNTGMLQLLRDIWAEVQSSRSLRLSLPIPLADRIHAVVAQQQHA